MSGRAATDSCNRFAEKCEPRASGCIEWTAATTGNGYGLFSVGPRRGGRMWLAHRWLWEQQHGTIPAGLDLCHHCDNRRCVEIDHLFVGTRKENMQDAVRKGRTSHVTRTQGESHGMAKLTMDNVKQIRAMRSQGQTLGTMASLFEVSIAQISRIVKNQSWKEIS